jgi:hypothetical protein
LRGRRQTLRRSGGEVRGRAQAADGPRSRTLAAHLSQARRSRPGGNRSRIARCTVICAARLIARLSMPRVWCSLVLPSLLNFEREHPEMHAAPYYLVKHSVLNNAA